MNPSVIAYVENVKGGTGSNTYYFNDYWGHGNNTTEPTLTVDIDESANTINKATLDFSEVTFDLTFKISKGGTVEVESTPQVVDTKTYIYKVTSRGIANIVGGNGNNTYIFEPTDGPATPPVKFPTLLTGTIQPGSPTQANTKLNTFDYSKSLIPIEANFSGTPVNFATTVTEPTRLDPAVPPIAEDDDQALSTRGIMPALIFVRFLRSAVMTRPSRTMRTQSTTAGCEPRPVASFSMRRSGFSIFPVQAPRRLRVSTTITVRGGRGLF